MEQEIAQPAHGPGAAAPGFNLLARGFDQAAVGDAAGAGRLAGAAPQAQADVRDVGIPQRHGAARYLDHLVDAPARRVHLDAQLAVRGTGVQAQPAMNAAVQIDGRRRGRGVLVRGGHTASPD